MAAEVRAGRVDVATARVLLGLLDRELRVGELRLRYGAAAVKGWE